MLSQIDGVDIQWLGFQSNRKKAEQLASRYHIPNITSDYKEITRSSVDFIVVVTPVYTHLDMIQEAMVTGKHVITDKPLALNLRQCEELVRLEKQYPIKSMIFFQWRFNNLLRTLRTMLDEKLSAIFTFDTAFYTEFMADENIPYLWRHNEDLGGSGVLSDMGVHLIDPLYWLTNGETVIEHSVLKTVYPIRKIETGKVRATQRTLRKFSSVYRCRSERYRCDDSLSYISWG